MEQEIFIKESLGIINNLKCCGNCYKHYKNCHFVFKPGLNVQDMEAAIEEVEKLA